MTIFKNGRRVKSRRAWRHRKVDLVATAARHFLAKGRKGSFVDIHGYDYLAGADMQNRHDLVMLRDHFKCLECGSQRHLQVHHVVTRAQGGSDNIDNLTTLCDPCHDKHHVRIGGRA